MKTIARFAAIAALGLAAGCATTPADRISFHQAEYNSWPPPVQAAISAGRVDPGFTPAQVVVAIGEPNSKSISQGPQGITEVWYYRRRAPRLGIGIGGGSYGRGGGVGGGVAVNGIKLGEDTSGQVVFMNGYVSNVVMTTH
jgi:hypothetical protein